MFSEEQKNWIRPWIPVLILQGAGNLLPLLVSSIPGGSAGMTALTDLLCLVVFLWMYRKDRQRNDGMHALQMSACAAGPSAQLVFLAAALPAGVVFSRLFGFLINTLGFFRFFSNEAQEMLFRSPVWLQLAGLGLIVPLAEELCYRGLCYTRCCIIMQPFWAALLVSGLFAAGHGNVIQMVYAFPMSLLITWFYERSGRRLACAVLFHMGANLASVIGNMYGAG